MNKIKQLSLRAKIIIGAITLNIVFAGVAFLNLKQTIKHQIDTQKFTFSLKANDFATAIGTQFFERYGDVQAFAKNQSIRNFNTANIKKDLNDYISLYGTYDLVLVVDKNGKYIASSTVDAKQKPVNIAALENYNFTSQKWFQSALKEQFTEDKDKGFIGTYFEDVNLDPIANLAFGEDRFFSSFSTPIKDYSGNTVGVIVSKANSRWYDVAAEEIYNNVSGLYPNVEFTILNKDGKYLLQHQPSVNKDKLNLVTHNPNQILKDKYFVEENTISKALAEKKSGVDFEIDPVNKEHDIAGYSYVNNNKWISSIGWSVLFHDVEEEVFLDINKAKTEFYWLQGVAAIFVLILSSWAGLVLSRKLEGVTIELDKNNDDLKSVSFKIAAGATQLAESTTEQSSALQETVATIDQISSMVKNNADAAEKAKELSNEGKNSALQGQQTVDSMLLAIHEIETNNHEMSHEMNQTNTQLSEITKMIHDISNKTKIINEIVFQTKLLSFNASVEAARAGEYGKGFAVVAEEVGKLAQMSGVASKEISEMLQHSIDKVESTIKNTKNKVDGLMLTSKEKIDFGSETAKQCKNALNEILQTVNTTDQLVSEIAVASREQSVGIIQISKAMDQLGNVTQQNASLAQSSSVSSEQLKHQAEVLSGKIDDLTLQIHGGIFQKSTENLKPLTNVVPFAPVAKKATQADSANFAPMLKKASGYNSNVPSSDDPGFNEA